MMGPSLNTCFPAGLLRPSPAFPLTLSSVLVHEMLFELPQVSAACELSSLPRHTAVNTPVTLAGDCFFLS